MQTIANSQDEMCSVVAKVCAGGADWIEAHRREDGSYEIKWGFEK